MRSLVDFVLAVGAENLKTDSPENHSNPAKRNDLLPHAALRLKTGKPFIPRRRVQLHRLPKAKRLIRASTSRRGPSSTKISGAKRSLKLRLPRPLRGRRPHQLNQTEDHPDTPLGATAPKRNESISSGEPAGPFHRCLHQIQPQMR